MLVLERVHDVRPRLLEALLLVHGPDDLSGDLDHVLVQHFLEQGLTQLLLVARHRANYYLEWRRDIKSYL